MGLPGAIKKKKKKIKKIKKKIYSKKSLTLQKISESFQISRTNHHGADMSVI